MERGDLLLKNAEIFSAQGKALNAVGKGKDTRVVVVGNPANTNALIASRNAPKIPPQNFCAMTKLVCVFLFVFVYGLLLKSIFRVCLLLDDFLFPFSSILLHSHVPGPHARPRPALAEARCAYNRHHTVLHLGKSLRDAVS
jgi:hypothetical protein